jgi:hypothetical protein
MIRVAFPESEASQMRMFRSNALSKLFGQNDQFKVLYELLDGNLRGYIASPEDVLCSGEYAADVAATMAFWIKEATTRGKFMAPRAEPPWWHSIKSFADVVVIRNTVSHDQGLQMLEEATLVLAGWLTPIEPSDEIRTWEMTNWGEVNIEQFLNNLIAHGQDHLTKVRIANDMLDLNLPLHWEK